MKASHTYGAAIDVANDKRSATDKDRSLLLLIRPWLFICRTEYEDNAQFNNLETIIVQNNVNVVYTFGSVETGKLQHIAKLLDPMDVKLTIVKKRWVWEMDGTIVSSRPLTQSMNWRFLLELRTSICFLRFWR